MLRIQISKLSDDSSSMFVATAHSLLDVLDASTDLSNDCAQHVGVNKHAAMHVQWSGARVSVSCGFEFKFKFSRLTQSVFVVVQSNADAQSTHLGCD